MPKHFVNPGPIRFTATIQPSGDERNSSAYIDFPYDLAATFGVDNLVPFKATLDGRVIYRGSLTKMGGASAMLLLRKDVRAELGKGPGEVVDVVVELDEVPREVIIPDDVKLALETANLLETFEALSYSRRHDYVEGIRDATKLETRLQRIEIMFEQLAEKSNT